MAYVPPALRKKNTASSDSPRDRLEPTALVRESAAEEDCVLSIENIQDHFWPRQYLDSDNSEEDGAELQEQTKGRGYNPYLNAVHKHSTLNGTAQEPDKLGYLLLFRGAVSSHSSVSNFVYMNTPPFALINDGCWICIYSHLTESKMDQGQGHIREDKSRTLTEETHNQKRHISSSTRRFRTRNS